MCVLWELRIGQLDGKHMLRAGENPRVCDYIVGLQVGGTRGVVHFLPGLT